MPRLQGKLALRLVGGVEFTDGAGEFVRMPTQKTVVVLAILALNRGRGIHRAALAECVWPDASPESARNSLRTALTFLRKHLPKGAIEGIHGGIRLVPEVLNCDALDPIHTRGDFMPGFDQDWVIDQRLRLRSEATEHYLDLARTEMKRQRLGEALAHAEEACRIDPYCQRAAELRILVLSSRGNHAEAAVVSDAHRAKTLRDLGVVSDVRPSAEKIEANPLVSAAEWLLDRDPYQALSLLASTHSHWLTMPVEQALGIHERALAAHQAPSSTRNLVEAQRYCLVWCVGGLAPIISEARDSYDRAVAAGESQVAFQLGSALAYGFLSAGDFRKSLHYAEASLHHATKSADVARRLDAELTLGTIQQQIGLFEQSRTTVSHCLKQIEESGTPLQRAFSALYASGAWLARGKPERAATSLSTSRRLFEASGATRMLPWVIHEEATLLESVGDLSRSRECREEIRRIGPEIGGHSIMAISDDWLAGVDCKLGEYVTAAEALARASVSRKKLGVVPSVYERIHTTPARRILKERLRPADLQAAHRRAVQGPDSRKW